MMQKRMPTREFKLEVVRQIASGQKRPAQACREYGLADSVLSRWRKEYQERGEAAFASQSGESMTQEQRIAELERFCGQLALENPVLKKALQSTGSRKRISSIQSCPVSACASCLTSVAVGTTNVAASPRATRARRPYAMKLSGSSWNFQAMAIDE